MYLRKCTLAASIALATTAGPALADGIISFEPVKVPETDAEKRLIIASESVGVRNDTRGFRGYFDIDFHTLLRSGDASLSGGPFGGLIDINGDPIIGADGSQLISNDNDFSSLLNVNPGSYKLFMVSHFETQPGAMYLTEIDQDPSTGKLTPTRTRPLDFSAVYGGWTHCAGSVTPWETHLGSEEYEPDAKLAELFPNPEDWSPDYYADMGVYFPDTGVARTPYDYGWPVEVSVTSFDNAQVGKHYAMGRMALELAYVLPDQRTVYMTDDGTGVGLFMFVADAPGDLSSGMLYIAEWVQRAGLEELGGRAGLRWHNMGHADSAEIRAAIDAGIQFSDMFLVGTPTDDGGCVEEGFISTNHGHDTGHAYAGHECLKLQDGEFNGTPIATLASRLESRRYGAMLGGTTEFRKMEGATFAPEHNVLLIAMSEISRGMEDYARDGVYTDRYDKGGPNHIRLPYNLCGAVYRSKLEAGVMDTDGNPIPSDLVAINMRGEVAGVMTESWAVNSPDWFPTVPDYDPEGPFAVNKCWLEGIANPDNITYIPGYKTLIIGEDTYPGHQSDVIWSYHVGLKTLTRIQTTPYGAETTSPYVYPNVNGFGYIVSVVQHPYGESDADKYNIGSLADRAWTGYIGPFPPLD